jgi:hypothetical protein
LRAFCSAVLLANQHTLQIKQFSFLSEHTLPDKRFSLLREHTLAATQFSSSISTRLLLSGSPLRAAHAWKVHIFALSVLEFLGVYMRCAVVVSL